MIPDVSRQNSRAQLELHRRRRSTSLFEVAVFGAVGTSTWTGARIAGLGPSDILTVCAVVLAAMRAVRVNTSKAIPNGPVRTVIIFASVFALVCVASWLVQGDVNPTSGMLGANSAAFGQSAFAGSQSGPLSLARVILALAVLPLLCVLGTAWNGRRFAFLVLLLWIAGGAVSSSVAVFETYAGLDVSSFTYAVRQDPYASPGIVLRATGLAFHPNSLGAASAVCLGATVPFIFSASKIRYRVYAGLIASDLLFGIFLSQSRGAIGAAVVAIFAGTFFSLSRRPVGVTMAFLIVTLASLRYAQPLLGQTRFANGEGDLSSVGRALARQEALSLFHSHPILGSSVTSIGAGVSVPFGLLAGVGILGLLVYYWYVAKCCIFGWKFRDAHPTIAIACGAATLVMVVVGLFENSVTERYEYVPLGLLLSLPTLKGKRGPTP